MKAGLITFHYAHHYGAQLQAYALMKTIESLGVPCEIIDYVRPDTIEGNQLFKSGFSPRALVSNLHTLLHYPSFKSRFDRFSVFVHEQMKLGSRHYSTYPELAANPPLYDLYVCGSDQIWNPLIFTPKDFDPSFFMPFAGTQRKIAYAPSFGISSIPEDKKESLKAYLLSFDALSVREQQGAEIIREVSGREAEVVLDPTLLLSEAQWSEICAGPQLDKPYMLCYFVSDPSPYFEQIAALSKALGLPVVTLCGSRKVIPGSISAVYHAGPREFLSLIKNASFVCSNSFHGVVFSILFQRNFASFRNAHNFAQGTQGKREGSAGENTAGSGEESSKKTVNSRLYNLLSTFGLTDRLIAGSSQDFDPQGKGWQTGIDYVSVLQHLESEREKSLKYLRDALYQDQA